ncbi:MAG TPA: glycosyltransferase [Solirubrobacteraceae bacterium]
MKILTVTNMYPFAGERYYGSFVREHVEALRGEGVEVDVMFVNPRKGKLRYLTELPRLARAMRRGSYDVLHAQHSYCAVQTAGLRSVLEIDTPLLFTIHEGEAYSSSSVGRSKTLTKRLAYWKRLKRLALDLSDHAVTVDERLLTVLGYRGPYSVIAPAVDTELFRPLDRAQCRRRLGLAPAQEILFFPASIARPEKGADVFKAALACLDRSVHVVYGGQIERAEMPVYMNAADVVVQTSHFEASPMVVKEAMACDTPVVSTDVGDVSALFGAAPGCFCADRDPHMIAAALRRALELTGPVGARERILASGLSPACVAGRYRELYHEMSGANRPDINRPDMTEESNGSTVASDHTSVLGRADRMSVVGRGERS